MWGVEEQQDGSGESAVFMVTIRERRAGGWIRAGKARGRKILSIFQVE